MPLNRDFDKAHKLDNVSYDIRGPVMDLADEMIANGEKVLKLNIGNPTPFGFRAPEGLVDEMIRQLNGQAQGYSHSKGIMEAREAILEYCKKKNMPNVTVNDIYTGNGASELIQMSLQALLNPGDEILVPAPDYPLWTASVNLAGGTAVHYLCDEKADWNPDIDDIKKKITPNTKGIVVINPNNPTGKLYSEDVLKQIVELARQHSLILFADEIYDRLVMDGKQHVALSSLAPDLLTVSFNGLSKSDKICGFRCGWMVLAGDKSRTKGYVEGLNLISTLRLCSNVPAQVIIPFALTHTEESQKLLEPGGRIYEQREYIYNALNEIPGVSAVKPDAAFYIFPKLDVKKFNITDDEQFAIDFLRDKKILITRGTGFNWPEPDHFRIVFLPDMDTLRPSMEGLKDFLSYYRQK